MKNTKNCMRLLLIAGFLSFVSLVLPPDSIKLFMTRLLMAYGPKDSYTEVYFFTDWKSEESEQANALVEKMASDLVKDKRFYFMDVSSEDLVDFNAINTSFLLNPDKDLAAYLKMRSTLFKLAKTVPLPSKEEMIEKLKEENISVPIENKEEIARVEEITRATIKNFSITKTPSVILYDLKNREKKVTLYPQEITTSSFSFLK